MSVSSPLITVYKAFHANLAAIPLFDIKQLQFNSLCHFVHPLRDLHHVCIPSQAKTLAQSSFVPFQVQF